MSKTTNTNNDDAAAKATAQPGGATQPQVDAAVTPATVRVKTIAKVTIGRIVYAPGLTVLVTADQAQALNSLGQARLLGV